METIKINGLDYTAEDLRDIAGVMDNPELMPYGIKDIEEFVERVGLK